MENMNFIQYNYYNCDADDGVHFKTKMSETKPHIEKH